jgi:ATP-binding cassette subfamily B protein
MVDPPDGAVFIGGVDVRQWDLGELRRFFGVSPQDSYLFSDTIKNNIAYGAKKYVSESQADESGKAREAVPDLPVDLPVDLPTMTRAALLSALDKDLEAFAMGWETLVGERGLTLSGGQKQRVAIARAVLSAPEILVLDDAFSAVDADTERRILSGILEERRTNRNKTTIIVSHRVSTLSSADKVAVLDQGKISEYGSPAELAAAGNFFARMAELQRLGEAPVTGGGDV